MVILGRSTDFKKIEHKIKANFDHIYILGRSTAEIYSYKIPKQTK